MFVQEMQQGPPREGHPQRGDLGEQEAPCMVSQELPVLGWPQNLTYCVISDESLPFSEAQPSPQKEGLELDQRLGLTWDRHRFSGPPQGWQSENWGSL